MYGYNLHSNKILLTHKLSYLQINKCTIRITGDPIQSTPQSLVTANNIILKVYLALYSLICCLHTMCTVNLLHFILKLINLNEDVTLIITINYTLL